MRANSGQKDQARGLQKLRLDRLMQLGEVVTGEVAPLALPDLAAYLASDQGVIRYEISGKVSTDQSGSQRKRLRCIILGWFEVADPETLEPVRFDLDIDSRLVIVASEAQLPPLEDEPEDEDYVVCGIEFDIGAHLQEEVLLALPLDTPVSRSSSHTPSSRSANNNLGREMKLLSGAVSGRRSAGRQVIQPAPEEETSDASAKPSPFAKLASLKKSD